MSSINKLPAGRTTSHHAPGWLRASAIISAQEGAAFDAARSPRRKSMDVSVAMNDATAKAAATSAELNALGSMWVRSTLAGDAPKARAANA